MTGSRVAEAERFMARFHLRNPGCTPRTMAFGRNAAGLSTYDLLVHEACIRGGAVLDLACGDGFLLARMKERRSDLSLTGIDLSEGELERARRQPALRDVRFVHGNARELPFQNGEFQTVTCHMAFMLMPEVHEVLREIRRVLSPSGGFFAIIPAQRVLTPAFRIFADQLEKAFAREGKTAEFSFADPRLKSEETLLDLFRGEGFPRTSMSLETVHFEFSPTETTLSFMETYLPSFLSPEGRDRLRSALLSEYEGLAVDGKIQNEFQARHLRVFVEEVG